MPDDQDHYEILQVHPTAEPEVISAAYRKLAQLYHPDLNKSPDAAVRMTAINLAYEELSDPNKRAEYDRQWQTGNSSGWGGAPSDPADGQSHGRTTEDIGWAGRAADWIDPGDGHGEPPESDADAGRVRQAVNGISRAVFEIRRRPWAVTGIGFLLSVVGMYFAFRFAPVATFVTMAGAIGTVIGAVLLIAGQWAYRWLLFAVAALLLAGGLLTMIGTVPVPTLMILGGGVVMAMGAARLVRRRMNT